MGRLVRGAMFRFAVAGLLLVVGAIGSRVDFDSWDRVVKAHVHPGTEA